MSFGPFRSSSSRAGRNSRRIVHPLLMGALTVVASQVAAETAYLGKKQGKVEFLDENLQTETSLDLSCLHDGVATDGQRIWCTTFGTTVYIYDLVGNLESQWSYVPGPYDYTGGMVYVADTNELAIMDVDTLNASQALRFFDPDTGVQLRSGNIGFGYIEGLAYDGTDLWVLDDDGTLRSYDILSLAPKTTLSSELDGCFSDCGGLAARGEQTLTVTMGPATFGADPSWHEVDKSTGAIVASGILPETLTGLSSFPVPECTPAPADLVAWYKGDTCGADDFLGHHDGVLVGLPVCPIDWRVGGGAIALFDGTYVVVPDDSELDPGSDELSLDAWILTDGGSSQPIVEKLGTTGYSLTLSGGKLRFDVCDALACSTVEGTSILDDGQWHLVAATLARTGTDSADISVYVDGTLEGTTSISELGTVASGTELRIGASPSTGTPRSLFDGVLDEVEIFARALTAAEVDALYTAGSAGKCTLECVDPPAGMVGWWPLDETTGTTASDRVDGNDGQYIGCPTPVVGKVDVALQFHGAERIEIASAPEPDVNDFSIDAWIRTTNLAVQTLVEKRQDGGFSDFGYHFFVTAGVLGLNIENLFGDVQASFGSTLVADGQWHHVAVTIDRSDTQGIRFYVDGVLDGTDDPTVVPGSLSSFTPAYVGGRDDGSTPFVGEIDEVELFDVALDAATVLALADAGSAGKCKDTPIVNVLLEATELRRGETSTLTVRGALPGESVSFARGTGATCGPCIPALGGLCVDVASPQLLGTAVADDDGVAVLEVDVPGGAPLVDVWLQAAIARGQSGEESVKSTVHAGPILP